MVIPVKTEHGSPRSGIDIKWNMVALFVCVCVYYTVIALIMMTLIGHFFWFTKGMQPKKKLLFIFATIYTPFHLCVICTFQPKLRVFNLILKNLYIIRVVASLWLFESILFYFSIHFPFPKKHVIYEFCIPKPYFVLNY